MRPTPRMVPIILLCLGIASAGAAEAPFLGPGIQRLLGRPALGQGPAGPARGPDEAELRLLAAMYLVDAESHPPRVHVRMQLGAPGRAEAAALGIALQRGRGDLVSAIVPLPRLRALTRLPGLEWIEASPRPDLELDLSLAAIGADTASQSYGMTGQGVVVGLIDSGLDVTHGDFRDADGNTRIRYLWDQTDDCGSPPPGFTYGCYYTGAQIDAFLDGMGTVSFPNADGHGTHVAGVAAGDGSQTGNGQPAFQYVGVAPEADLIAVKIFPEAGSCPLCNGGDGLLFIEDRAAALGEPFVVNMSYGSDLGGHDGSSGEEILIDTVTGPGIPGKAVVKSAGNNRGIGIHASGTVTNGTFNDHQFVIPTYTPAAGTFNDIVVWQLWQDGGDILRVWIATPSLTAFPKTTAICACIDGTNPGTSCTTDADCTGGGSCSGFDGVGTDEGVLIIDTTCVPTANGSHVLDMEVDDQLGTAPASGTWTFRVRGESITQSGRYDMWIWFSSFGLGGQTTEWTVPDPSQLVTTPGNAFHATTVGSFDTKTEWTNVDGDTTFYSPPLTLGALSDFSSPGGTRDGRLKPEIAAPGQAIASALAADAAPAALGNPFNRLLVTADGEHWTLAGTSFAAPHVTGTYALLLQVDPTLDATQLRDLVTSAAVIDGFTGAVPNDDWGQGKVNVQAALDNLFKPIPDLAATDETSFVASAIPQATSYDVFRTTLSGFDGSDYGFCLAPGLPGPSFTDPSTPAAGDGYGYTVAGNKDGIDGQIGQWSDGTIRPRPVCP